MSRNNVWELFSLKGCVAIVTGGASGLGYDMALALAEAGADVAITSRNLAKAERAAEKIGGETGHKIIPLTLEVTREDEVIQMVNSVLKEFGKIDVLVNNAGNVRSTKESAPFEVRPLKEWKYTVDVNVTGSFLCAKYVIAKCMIPNKRGVVINIGSTAGMIGKDRRVYQGIEMVGVGVTVDYSAAKGAVIAMTKDMAAYLAPYNIRVNCISPGGFYRESLPEKFCEAYRKTFIMGRQGEEGKELKGAVVFLASEASSFVTAHNLVVDGGLTQW